MPLMRAWLMVSGMKMLLSRASWSKKFCAPVRKLEISKVQREKGIAIPNSRCSSRSPCSGIRSKPSSEFPVMREQRRRLVVAAVKSAQDPVQPWDSDGSADTWVGGIFADGVLSEVSQPQAAVERQPVSET